ncbi:MAG: hypothetical protein PHQ23_05280 [Candidatus Wallbacteria bacterium]|nr:hypothetical protein [Candidatus Wallbacteria bacterium]
MSSGNETDFIAHVRGEDECRVEQPLIEHLQNTAKMAGDFADASSGEKKIV